MSDLIVTLVEARFGMGNVNHVHVHRHNTMEIGSLQLDEIKFAQMDGGVSPALINQIANTVGGITAQPQGPVSIEDGWNIRRGIGMLRFQVTQNALVSRELSVLGYLYGGANTPDGIDAGVMFVPQRSWTVEARQNIHPMQGLPQVQQSIVESNQFLLGDPDHVKKLKAMRPLDLAQEVLGMMAMEEESHNGIYHGDTSSDLSRNIVMSKTHNLNTTHHAAELIKMAASGIHDSQYQQAQMGIAESLRSASLNEISPAHNEFIMAMCTSLGNIQLAGFQGYSVGELNAVFDNFADCLDLTLMDENLYPDAENLLNSSAQGSITFPEILAKEMAVLTVHLLIREGLQHITFSATNNPQHTGGIGGSPEGFEFIPAQFGSVLTNDNNAIGRVERFRQNLATSFFAKYNANPYSTHATMVNVEVSAHMFGETQVLISVNDGPVVSYIEATYALSRTSTNIAAREAGLNESQAILTNLKAHLDFN